MIAKRHAPELHHLTPDERSGVWADVAAIGEVITTLFRPVKLANLSMGFRMPHYHCHVWPQYREDDPFRVIDLQDSDLRLDDSEWQDRLEAMRQGFVSSAEPT